NGIFVIFDDVDLLATQFADDRLHAHSLHPHAGADGIHIFVLRHYGNFRAFAGFASDRADNNGTVVDLGNLGLKEMLNKFRRCAPQTTTCRPCLGRTTRNRTTRTRSPTANDSSRDCSFFPMRASALPMSMMTSGPSMRFTVALMISPMRG